MSKYNVALLFCVLGFCCTTKTSVGQELPQPGVDVPSTNDTNAPATRPRTIVPLPSPMTQLVIGGSGKYLIAFMQLEKQVVIFDVVAKKIFKTIPVDDTDVLLAGGDTRFVVLQRGSGVISRYNVMTGERELTATCEPYIAIAMGSSAEGPILTLGKKVELLDLKTLTPNGISVYDPRLMERGFLLAAANGTVFGGWHNHGSPTGLSIFSLVGDKLVEKYEHTSVGCVRPSPDGMVIYTSGGRYSVDGKPISGRAFSEQLRAVPAATGSFYLAITKAVGGNVRVEPYRLTMHHQQTGELLLTIKDVTLPAIEHDIHPVHFDHLPLERHLLLLPEASSLVTVPFSSDQFVVHPFDVRTELNRQGNDYFFVASVAPTQLRRGQKLLYPIEVYSKHRELEYKLELGPPGMSVSIDGELKWEVPNDFANHDAIAIVHIRNGKGQEISHTIRLSDKSGQPNLPNQSVATVTPKATAPDPTAEAPLAKPVPSPAAPERKPEEPTPIIATTPTSVGENRWDWMGVAPVFVRGERGSIAGILCGTKLCLLDATGAVLPEPINVPSTYLFAGLRSGKLIGVAKSPARIEMLDEKGKEIRRVLLDDALPTGFAMHPHKPICYVAQDRVQGEIQGTFVAIDEQTGAKGEEDEQFGQVLEIDPSGRFLVAGFAQSIHLGDQIVVTRGAVQVPRQNPVQPVPGKPVPGRPGSYRPNPGRPNIGGRSQYQPPLPPQVGGAQIGVRSAYADIVLALTYDLDSPMKPAGYRVIPMPEVQGGQLRISYDGRKVTGVARDNRLLVKYAGYDPLDRKTPMTRFESVGYREIKQSDLAHHPLLPLSVIGVGPTLVCVNSSTGAPILDKKLPTLEFGEKYIQRIMFSADGEHLVAVAKSGANEYALQRVRLPLTDSEKVSMQERAAKPPHEFKDQPVPLAALTAFRGGLVSPKKAAQVAANFTDSVVIVRRESSTGTGFVVGSAGWILTCAHCISPLENVEVVYHPESKPDESKTVAATVVCRDKKLDLALLKIETPSPLHAVLLADPRDVQSGEDVTIIANPGLGAEVLNNTVTTGIISNGKRTIEGNTYIQSSAAVNPGSSGGPMFDGNGCVIGVVVLKAGIENVGFAVPPDRITQFLIKSARRSGDDGQLTRNWVSSDAKSEFEGRLVSIESGVVNLASPGNSEIKASPLTTFSAGDQKFLELLSAEK